MFVLAARQPGRSAASAPANSAGASNHSSPTENAEALTERLSWDVVHQARSATRPCASDESGGTPQHGQHQRFQHEHRRDGRRPRSERAQDGDIVSALVERVVERDEERQRRRREDDAPERAYDVGADTDHAKEARRFVRR